MTTREGPIKSIAHGAGIGQLAVLRSAQTLDQTFPRQSCFRASEAEISKGFHEALRAALQRWQLETGHALRFWLRGYCACFAATLVKFIGEPASLSSVVASDGNVHHIVVVLCDLVIDARGVNTRKSLLAEINREAEASDSSLRAVDIIPFELQHERLLKECPDNEAKTLRACLNTPAMRCIRRRIRIVASG